MPQNIRRRLFGRIVLWDTKGGTIIDLPSRNVLSFGGPSESEEYVRLASGDREVISRSHTAQIPITRREAAEVSEVLQKVGCPFKAAFLGINGTDSWMWLEPTKLQVTDPEVSAGQLSEKVLELNTNVFYPAIWEGMSLIEGVPWRGTSSVEQQDGTKLLKPKQGGRNGYEGPTWRVQASASGSLAGESFNINSSDNAFCGIQLPAWGCELETNNVNAILEARDWDFNILERSRDSLKLPPLTYFVRLILDGKVSRPKINIKSIGAAKGVNEGKVSTDCTKVSTPLWMESEVTLTGEDI